MKITIKQITLLFLTPLMILGALSCKKDSSNPTTPIDPGAGSQEYITKVIVTFRAPFGLGPYPSCTFSDQDGTGRTVKIDTLKIPKSSVYDLCHIIVLDETKSPVDTVSNAILKEGAYHRFHFTYMPNNGNGSFMNFTLTDKDKNGLSIGLQFKDSVGNQSGTGTFNVNLRHFSNGLVKNDDPKAGEADIFVNFPVQIK
jgi:hypothetical protein